MIKIMVNEKVIGTVEGIRIMEEGTNVHNMQYRGISFDRITFSRESLAQAFNNQIVHRTSQRDPLNVPEYEDIDGNLWYMNNIWIDQSETASVADDTITVENVQCSCESIIMK